MRNVRIQETERIGEALASIAELLPASWRLEYLPGDGGGDSFATLIGSGGVSVTYRVNAKQSGSSVAVLLATLREQALTSAAPVLFVSDYIGPSLRKALATEGISFADSTGWVRVASDAPLLLLTAQGASRSPRAGRSAVVARLNGVATSRIIRVLCHAPTPMGVRELAALAHVSPGSVSKLLPTLTDEGIVDRDQRGGVTSVRRRALIRRWVQDYAFGTTSEAVGYYIAPRGLDRTLTRLERASGPWTVTGSAAARRLLPKQITSVVPLRLLAVYAASPGALADDLGLVRADRESANAIVAIPQDDEVLRLKVAPPALVLADLLTLPGRGDAEANQLMDVLASTDQAWEE